MPWSKKQLAASGLIILTLVAVILVQHRRQASLKDEHQSLQHQLLNLQSDTERLSNQLAQATLTPAEPADYSNELARLRSEADTLRRQTNEQHSLLAMTGNERHRTPASDPDQVLAVMPEDYPQTPQAATQFVLDFFSRGDADQFFTYFGQRGARTMYDALFADERTQKLIGMKVISIGQPTNHPVYPDMLMVPFTALLRDGSKRESVLRLVQDPESRRWFFKGGL